MDNAHASSSDSPTTSPEASPAIEAVAPGITLEWLHDGRIPVFTMATVARTSIDAWIERLKKLTQEWQADRPFLSMHDISDRNVGATPYFRARVEEIPTWRPEGEAHIALVLPRTIQGKVIQMFVQARKGQPVRIFFTREEGLAWLQSHLEGRSDR
jgi:hypothetical protein